MVNRKSSIEKWKIALFRAIFFFFLATNCATFFVKKIIKEHFFYSANRFYVAKNTGNFLISNNFITNLFVSFLFFLYLCSDF